MPLQEEEVVDIPGLSGEEIIVDFCEQIAAALRRDCNLRPQDSYVNGYSAEISGLKLHCYGIDTADVELTNVKAGKRPEKITEGTANTTEIETDITVALEPDLKEVRDRSGLTAPDVEQIRQPETGAAEVKEGNEPQRRRYAGKPRVAGGGAGSFDE